jgi:dihydrofolate reductase
MKAIVAMAANRVIGAGNKIPWHLPEDLKFFKATTLGHPVIMGRKTYDSIGKPLPGRQNMILSRMMPETPGVTVFRSPEELLRLENSGDLFVIGGAEIYKLLLPWCDELIVTHVPKSVRGDAWFPEFEPAFNQGTTVYETPEFTTVRYERIRA